MARVCHGSCPHEPHLIHCTIMHVNLAHRFVEVVRTRPMAMLISAKARVRLDSFPLQPTLHSLHNPARKSPPQIRGGREDTTYGSAHFRQGSCLPRLASAKARVP